MVLARSENSKFFSALVLSVLVLSWYLSDLVLSSPIPRLVQRFSLILVQPEVSKTLRVLVRVFSQIQTVLFTARPIMFGQ